jgi:hypothetical protein
MDLCGFVGPIAIGWTTNAATTADDAVKAFVLAFGGTQFRLTALAQSNRANVLSGRVL